MKKLLLLGLLISAYSMSHAASNPIAIISNESCKDGICGMNACDIKKIKPSPNKMPSSLFSKEIHWQEYSPTVIAQVKNTHQLILLFIKTEECPWSKKMAKLTFENSSVISQINDNFIPLYSEFTDNNTAAMQYQVSAVPTTIILDPNGTIIKEVAGYIDPVAMTKLLSETAKSYQKA